jgi:drug/metabolite transporter (DMT)-like permease
MSAKKQVVNEFSTVMKITHNRAVALMVLCPLLWSTAGVVTKHLDLAASFEVTFWRSFFTVVSLLILLSLTRGWSWYHVVPWRSRALWVSGVCWSVMFSAFMIAMVLTSVANVLITLAAGPLLTALVSRIITKHPLPSRTYVAIGLAALGISYMFWSQFSVGNSSDIAGCLIALLVPMCGSIMWTNAQIQQMKHVQQSSSSLDLVPSVFLGAIVSSITMLPFALPLQATAHDVVWLGFLGLFQLAIPCSLAVIAARVLKAAEVSLLALLEIVFGITWAWLFVDEVPSHQVLTGGVMVLVALLGNVLLSFKNESS